MEADRRKLVQLRRLAGLRAIARQAAAGESARAEARLGQLQALTARSDELAADYAGRTDAAAGADLRRVAMFAAGLQAVSRQTGADTARARVAADLRQGELERVERSRAAVQDQVDQVTRAIAARAQVPILSARRR